jgi:uncharacterized membrane protein
MLRMSVLVLILSGAGCVSAETQARVAQAEARYQKLEDEAKASAAQVVALDALVKAKPAPTDEERQAVEAAKALAETARNQAVAAKAALDEAKQYAKNERWNSGVHFTELGLEVATPFAAAAFPWLLPILTGLGSIVGAARRNEKTSGAA